MSIYQKYLEDKDGNIFSPIVSIDSVYGENDKKLIDIIKDMIYPVGSIYFSVDSVYGENDKKLIDIIKDMIYPVGSIYFSVDSSFNPNIEWGGMDFVGIW